MVRKMIRSELTTSSNIKSKTTRKAVEGALHQILTHLPDKMPPEGVGVYASDDTVVMVVPDLPLRVGDYICAKHFLVEPLQELFKSKQKRVYGWLWWSGKEAAYQDTTMQHPIKRLREGGGNKRHNKGGQSAPRFQRRFDSADAAWERDIAEWVGGVLSPRTVWVFVAGSSGGKDSEPVQKCRQTCGVGVHRAENRIDFSRDVASTLIPAQELQWAKDQEALCWDLLQRYPDKTKVGRAECVESIDLLKRIWVEEHRMDEIRPLADCEIIEMPKGSLARMGEIFGELHYAAAW